MSNDAPVTVPAAAESLSILKAGNQRFCQNTPLNPDATNLHNVDCASQSPMAIVVCCSDSRVPPEVVFNCGLGELFVVRVAGNIVTPSGIGSVEFAAVNFNVPLVVVLGHTFCGAVKATLQCVQEGTLPESPHLAHIVENILPVAKRSIDAYHHQPSTNIALTTIRANITEGVHRLKNQSDTLADLIGQQKLQIIGAVYDMKTGQVDFFED